MGKMFCQRLGIKEGKVFEFKGKDYLYSNGFVLKSGKAYCFDKKAQNINSQKLAIKETFEGNLRTRTVLDFTSAACCTADEILEMLDNTKIIDETKENVDEIVIKKLDEFLEKVKGNRDFIFKNTCYRHRNNIVYREEYTNFSGHTYHPATIKEIFNMIKNPDDIILEELKENPSDKQLKVINGLCSIGLRYLITSDTDNQVLATSLMPNRGKDGAWCLSKAGTVLNLSTSIPPDRAIIMEDLISSEYFEPYDMMAVLRDNGMAMSED